MANVLGKDVQEQERMVSVRLVQTMTLLLGILSFLLGAWGFFTEEAGSIRQFVMIVLPGLMGFAIVLRKWKNIPVDGKRNLAYGKVETILDASVKPRDYPFCVHLCATHANAVSAAGLSSRNVSLRISQLIMIINQESTELNPLEKVFSINVVETHLILLRSIHSILKTLSSDSSLVAECYRLLKGGNDVMEAIDKASVMMESNIIRPMDRFLQKIPAGVDRNTKNHAYKDEVKDLVKETIPGKLAEVMKELIAVDQTAQKIQEEMQADWHDDGQECQKDYFCAPLRKKRFAPKQKLKIESVERAVVNWRKKNMSSLSQRN